MESPSGAILALESLELLTSLAAVPISLANFALVWRTAVIHRNLKVILLYQSAFIFVRTTSRLAISVGNAIVQSPDPLSVQTPVRPLNFLFVFGLLNRNLMPHVLIVERGMATWLSTSYERKRNWRFSAVWIPIVFGCSLYGMLANQQPLATLLLNYVLLCVVLFEVVLFLWLCRYNTALYRRKMEAEHEHNLSERYQLCENIRIGKQLVPALCLHLMNIAMNNLNTNWSYFGAATPSQFVQRSVSLSTSVGTLAIEVTTILRDLFALFAAFRGLFRSNQVRDTDRRQECAIALRDMNGKVLRNVTSQNEHFAMLKRQWGE